MDIDRSYIERNSSSLRRLHTLVGRLHNDDFDRDAGGGWTIGAVLAHVAFWDRYVTTRLSRWEKQGFKNTPLDPDSINDAALPGWRAIPGRVAVSEALAAAQECDARTAEVAEVVAAAILAAGRLRVLDRSIHRGEHIDQIERALSYAR
jgi:DinB superfamily